MRKSFVAAAFALAATGAFAQQGDWPTYTSKQFGLEIAYPDAFVGDMSRAAEGHFDLEGGGVLILSLDELNGEDLKPFLRRNLLRDIDVTYERRKNNWMAYSGYAGDQIVYGRTHLSCGGRYAHSFLIRYPVAERATYDRVVEKLSHSLRVSPEFRKTRC
jgi:hypothetical protein